MQQICCSIVFRKKSNDNVLQYFLKKVICNVMQYIFGNVTSNVMQYFLKAIVNSMTVSAGSEKRSVARIFLP